jgi:hypothetical protein
MTRYPPLILAQADAAIEAARRAHKPAKTKFTVGFLTGHEIGWLPQVLRVLGDLLEATELIIRSAFVAVRDQAVEADGAPIEHRISVPPHMATAREAVA